MKSQIRKEILSHRSILSTSEVETKSQAILSRLSQADFFRKAKNVMVYLDFRNEVKTDKIIDLCLSLGKRVFVPLCVTETRELVISELRDKKHLEEGFYGILTPKKEHLYIEDRNILDLVLIPGAAFDCTGSRIGYGAGYYDKFFSHMRKKPCKAALAYGFQIVEHIPASPHDVPMDFICTEDEIISI